MGYVHIEIVGPLLLYHPTKRRDTTHNTSAALPLHSLTDFETPWFWPHGIEIVHDVYIVFESWKGAQGQGPAIDLVLCVSMIKVDTDGDGAKSSTGYILEHHVNIQFNKIPQLAMYYNVKGMGAWFHKR